MIAGYFSKLLKKLSRKEMQGDRRQKEKIEDQTMLNFGSLVDDDRLSNSLDFTVIGLCFL